MTTLADFQRSLAAHIRHGAAVPPGLVADGPAFPAARRLAVYHDAYRLRLIDALGEDFPLLRALLGDAGFGPLAQRYLAACPSLSHSLRDLGRGLAGFLARRPALRATATFEWALLDAFDAADVPTLTATDLAAVPARLPAPVDCLIWRREQRVYFRTLPADEAIAAAALRQGRSFGVICNALARAGDVDTAPTRAAQLLASWLAEGLLAA